MKEACTPCKPKGSPAELNLGKATLCALAGRDVWGGQGNTAYSLCFGRGNSVILMLGTFSLTVSPSMPPCLVSTSITPVATPTTAEQRASVSSHSPCHECAHLILPGVPRQARVLSTLGMRHRLREVSHFALRHMGCRNSTGTQHWASYTFYGLSGQMGERSENSESQGRPWASSLYP